MGYFTFYCSAHHSDLHSFPTRRSSDLQTYLTKEQKAKILRTDAPRPLTAQLEHLGLDVELNGRRERMDYYIVRQPTDVIIRSEEHTSELQSHVNLVCRLLLEKKKKKTN